MSDSHAKPVAAKTEPHDKEKKGGAVRDALDLTAGLLDPEIAKWGEAVAAKVPQNSILRKELFRRLFGAAKQFVEGRTNKLPPLIGVPLERVIDFLDSVGDNLGKQSKPGHETHEKKETPDPVKAWRAAFHQEAKKRMAETKGLDATRKLATQLIYEYILLEEIEKMSAPPHEEELLMVEANKATLKENNDEWEKDLAEREARAGIGAPFWKKLRRSLTLGLFSDKPEKPEARYDFNHDGSKKIAPKEGC
jgi:hypothetical protein